MALLSSLRRATLTRALVDEQIDRLREQNRNVGQLQRALSRIDTSFAGLSIEWHRFDLDGVDTRLQTVIADLEGIHEQLGE
jgi:hypothetical protein